jgi:hypothetical protein
MILQSVERRVQYPGQVYAVNSAGDDVAGAKGCQALEDIGRISTLR